MNDLNSVLLEGVVERVNTGTTSNCEFNIASSSVNREEEKYDISCFTVTASGKLGETCNAKCREGVRLRIVGKLKEVDGGTNQARVVLVAEHIEFKGAKNE